MWLDKDLLMLIQSELKISWSVISFLNQEAKNENMTIRVWLLYFFPLDFNPTIWFNHTEVHLVCSENSRCYLKKFNREVKGKIDLNNEHGPLTSF